MIIMNEEDRLFLRFINRSSYRVKILNCIGDGYKIPSVIAAETGLLRNHVSVGLQRLIGLGLVRCLNPDAKRARVFRLTDKGLKFLGKYNHVPNPRALEKEAERKAKLAKKSVTLDSFNDDGSLKKD